MPEFCGQDSYSIKKAAVLIAQQPVRGFKLTFNRGALHLWHWGPFCLPALQILLCRLL